MKTPQNIEHKIESPQKNKAISNIKNNNKTKIVKLLRKKSGFRVLRESIHQAQNPYLCWQCHEQIDPWSLYKNTVIVDNWKLVVQKEHESPHCPIDPDKEYYESKEHLDKEYEEVMWEIDRENSKQIA